MKNKEEFDELLTVDEVEARYRIPKGTQATMRHRRQIPFVQIGPRMPRYRRAEIEAWIAEKAKPVAASGTGR